MSSWLEYKKNSIENSSWNEYKKKQIEKEKEDQKKQEIINDLKNSTTVNQQITQLPTANNSNVNYLNNTKNSLIKPIETSAPFTNNVLPEDAKKLTSTDIKAMEEAIELNKEIEKGGSDAVNAVIGNTIKSFTGGVQNGVAGMANAVMLPVAGIFQMAGNENVANAIFNEADEISARGNYSSNVNSRIDNTGVRTVGNVMNTVGNMAPSILANVAMPGSGLAMTGISAGGNSAQETLNYRKDNMGKALTTGVLKGAVEMATEKITGGNKLTKGGLDDFAVRLIGNNVKSEIGQKIASKGYEFFGEILEEELSDVGGYIIDKVINNKDMPSLKEAWNNAGETAKMTFLSTLVLHAFGLGGDTYNDVQKFTKNKEANAWIDEAMKIAKQENLDTMIRNDIEERVIQKDAQNQANNQVNTQEQQTISQENKMVQNGNMEQVQPSLPTRALTYEESARKYNIDTNNETVKAIYRFAKNRGVMLEYNADVFKNSSEESVWVDDGKNRHIYINPNVNSETTLQKLMVHEMFHDTIATKPHDKLTRLVMNKLMQDSNYEANRQSVIEAYKDQLQGLNEAQANNLINEEMTAKYLGENLGNQEFVSELIETTERSTIDRIIEWIDNRIQQLKNVVTGNQEAEYWRSIRENIVRAYNSKYKGTEGKKYSIAGINSKTTNIDKLNQAIQMEREGKTNEEIYEKTGFYKGNEGKWRYEIGNENARIETNLKGKNLIYTNQEKETLSNIIAELNEKNPDVNNEERPYIKEAKKLIKETEKIDLDLNDINSLYQENNKTLEDKFLFLPDILKNNEELFEAYPFLNDIQIKLPFSMNEFIDKSSGTLGFVERKSFNDIPEVIYITPAGLKDTRGLKKIILHEVQHAIQAYEGFSNGADIESWNRKIANDIHKEIQKLSDKIDWTKNAADYYELRTAIEKYIDSRIKLYNFDYAFIHDDSEYSKTSKILKEEGFYNNQSYINHYKEMTKKASDVIKYEYNKNNINDKKIDEKLENIWNKIKNQNKKAYELYKNTAGEIEAREVEKRSEWSEETRKNKLPFIKNKNTVYFENLDNNYKKPISMLVEKSNKKVYNIINKSINNDERAQVSSEVLTWRKNQADGMGYIDLSAKGYKSYIYNKQGSNIETLLKVNGSEEFKNYIRKGIEDGAFTGTEGFNKSIAEIRNKYRRYSNDNDLLPRTKSDNSDDKLSPRLPRQEGNNNTANNTEQNSRNESIENSNKSSFILPENNYRDSHQIDASDSVSLNNLNLDEVQEKVKKANGALSRQDYSDLNRLKKIKDSDKVTIYRASPVNELNNGDWVTTDKTYAQDMARENGGKVYSYEVSADELLYPNNVKDLPSLHRLSSFQYNTKNNNLKYSKKTDVYDNYLKENSINEGKGQTIQEVKLPKVDKTIQDVGLPIENTTVNQDTNQTTEKADILPVTPEQKARKHYKSIIESNYTTQEAKAVAKELMGVDTYEPDSNKSQIERADAYIEKNGVDKALDRLVSNVETDSVTYDRLFKKVGVDDVALGERLIQYYSKIGDATKLQLAIRATAAAGTDAGRAVQAFSILNHQTPTGQVAWIQRSVDKVNKELKDKRGSNAPQFDFTPEMQQKILNTTTQEDMFNAIDEVYSELGQQVSKSTMEKIDSWRYFSMLANPKTHIRNIVGNIAMGGMQSVKNKVAGAIEDTVAKFNPEMERTHTLKRASKEIKEFAKNDLKNLEVQTSLDMNSNKYNPKTRLENSMRTFKSDALENTLGKLFDINDRALEVEDAWGLKAAYAKSLAEYMTANNLNPDIITDSQLAKARKFATEQAKEATFHQANALASALTQFSKKNNLTKFATDAILPFKKTPANIAKAGVEYSPVGLAKSVIYDSVQLRKGNISVNKYIDNISKGLTGTGVTLLGYALASAGVLKASGGNDKDKEKYDQDRGNQTYSLQIGDNTYSLDWLAPTGIPLFIGAEIYELKQQEDKTKSSSSDDESSYNQAIKSAENIFNSFAHAVDPMTEMSMLSGLTSTLRSYDENLLAGVAVNTGKSYIGQFVPTALGQEAKTTDEYERNTTSTKTGTLPKAIDSTKNQIMAKIPGLRQQLPVKNDIWGNEIKQSENIVERALENSVFPYTKKTISDTNVDKALTKLYEETGDSAVIPDVIDKTFTIDGQKYRMTNEEYAKYRKMYGETSYNLINDLVTNKEYDKLTTEQKQKAIESVYSYAKEANKIDYANNNKLTVKPSTLYTTMEDLKNNGGKQSEYLNYLAKTSSISKETEKNKALLDSNYTNKTKETIYSNGTGKDDGLYNIMSNTGINIDEYLKYKTQEFESDKEDDGTTTGKTISGSKKSKVYDYVNNMDITYNQKLLLLGTQYSLTDNERTTLAHYINSLNISKDDKLEMYGKLKGFTVYKDGRIKW